MWPLPVLPPPQSSRVDFSSCWAVLAAYQARAAGGMCVDPLSLLMYVFFNVTTGDVLERLEIGS